MRRRRPAEKLEGRSSNEVAYKISNLALFRSFQLFMHFASICVAAAPFWTKNGRDGHRFSEASWSSPPRRGSGTQAYPSQCGLRVASGRLCGLLVASGGFCGLRGASDRFSGLLVAYVGWASGRLRGLRGASGRLCGDARHLCNAKVRHELRTAHSMDRIAQACVQGCSERGLCSWCPLPLPRSPGLPPLPSGRPNICERLRIAIARRSLAPVRPPGLPAQRKECFHNVLSFSG